MRIWTFGCSFTEYCWPTWADIIIHHGESIGAQGYNLGRCGAGNQYIASRIWECNARYKFTTDDWCFICWTGFNREDRFTTHHGWTTPGNIGTQDTYNEEFVRSWADERHYAMRDCMLITSTLNGLQNLGVNVVTWTMNSYKQFMDAYSFHTAEQITDIVDTYNLTFNRPSMMEFLGTVNQDHANHSTRLSVTWNGKDVMPEFHPTPIEHMQYLQRHVISEVPWASQINPETLDFAIEWEHRLRTMPSPINLSSDVNWRTPNKDIKVWQ